MFINQQKYIIGRQKIHNPISDHPENKISRSINLLNMTASDFNLAHGYVRDD